MNEKDNGGPAFPGSGVRLSASDDSPHISAKEFSSEGMTLRDYFAAKALGGIMANHVCQPQEQFHFDNIAEDAYRVADAMLEARKQ